MKRSLAPICVFVLLAMVFGGCTKKNDKTTTDNRPVLNIYCWASYFSPELIKSFEEQTHTRVVQTYFSSNDELMAKLEAGARGYDLIVPSAYIIQALKKLNLIEPLGHLKWPEIKNLSKRFAAMPFVRDNAYAIPYAWGTTGIAVNRAKIKAKVDSWAWMFNHPELKGQITMFNDSVAAVGAALKYLGYPYNDSDPQALARAKAVLIRQKKWVRAYTPEDEPVLVSGEAALSQAYSGDAYQVRNGENPKIDYVLPKEGGELYVDTLAIPVGARSPELAKKFMRFTLRKKMALVQVEHLFFGPVVNLSGIPAEIQLGKRFPAIFPSQAQLAKFEMAIDNPKRLEAIEKIWIELKSI